ncbi:hypothetical protein HAX54_028501 [Datura stramonium]|uniref:Uncharacterized protein n=1 Tax=Datura stramonium TaxID=4076 RepID=A0ABS8S9J9_DATST|nr:hypothetical protein [Datura stramonium]
MDRPHLRRRRNQNLTDKKAAATRPHDERYVKRVAASFRDEPRYFVPRELMDQWRDARCCEARAWLRDIIECPFWGLFRCIWLMTKEEEEEETDDDQQAISRSS